MVVAFGISIPTINLRQRRYAFTVLIANCCAFFVQILQPGRLRLLWLLSSPVKAGCRFPPFAVSGPSSVGKPSPWQLAIIARRLFPELSLSNREYCWTSRRLAVVRWLTSAAPIDRGCGPFSLHQPRIALCQFLLRRRTRRWESCLQICSRTSRFPVLAWHCSPLKSATWGEDARRLRIASTISGQGEDVTVAQQQQLQESFD